MGHSSAIVKLLLTELPADPSPRAIMDAAVQKWREDEAGRWDAPRYGYPELSPIASEKVAYSNLEEDEDGRTESQITPFTSDYTEKSSTVRLQVTADELKGLRRGDYWKLLEAGRFDEHTVAVEIAQLPKPRAPRAEATEGKATTLYKVVDGNGRPIRSLEPFPSQAAARSAAIEFLKENPACSELAVEAFIQRDTGKAALVTITRPEPETATVTFKVTTQTPKPKAKVAGYIVAFDYHH